MITSNKIQPKISRMVQTYESLIFAPLKTLSFEMLETDEHLRSVPDESYPWQKQEPGCQWGKPWGNAWFRTFTTIEADMARSNVFVRSHLGGVETLFFVDGEERGIFSHEAEVGARGNHHTILMHKAGDPAGTHQLAFECYAGHPCVGTQPMDPREAAACAPSTYRHAAGGIQLMERHDDVMAFVFDLKTLVQLTEVLPESSFRRGNITRAFVEVFKIVSQCPGETPEEEWRPALREAREVMAPLLAAKNSDSAPFAGLTGHSHMDTAWLWTSKETIRKCARTFSNALNLMEQYPEYRFIQSSPIHAEMILEHYPRLFERIKASVAEGRWEPNGGMYVESDGNMPSGESFVRQFLYGQAFTREHFGYTADSFWLPDTFGYSAAFPQIMKGCGVKYFLTTKLSWNDTNRFPYDTFTWRGLDGSEVLVHFNITHAAPELNTLVQSIEGDIRHADVADKRLISYGKGDGGGGPTFEEIEMARRVADLEGCPKSQHMSVSQFMGLLEQDQHRYPVYDGELYVELHRGVHTVQHLIKRLNRKCEWALRDMELMDVLGDAFGLPALTPETIRNQWKVLLKNQFHDILPGTSIPEEHDEAKRALGALLDELRQTTAGRLTQAVEAGDALTVMNPFSWSAETDLVVPALPDGHTLGEDGTACQSISTLEGESMTVVGGIVRPAMALSSHPIVPQTKKHESPFQLEGDVLTTPWYRATLNEAGSIDSLIDRRTGREVRGGGLPLNALLIGEDLPINWDNWDIDSDQALKMAVVEMRESRETFDGPLQFRIRQEYRLGRSSRLWQDMVFHKNSAQIDFETKVDWQEKHAFLKAGFDLNVRAMHYRSDIQFGWVERSTHTNTTFDGAKFEVCQHKWSDLSEPGYGVALLNDCKYGISVNGSDMRISLLKSGGHPDPRGDAGAHFFRYALLPHAGGFGAEAVIRPAYHFNHRECVCPGTLRQPGVSLVTPDVSNVVVESAKRAEDGNGIILRLVELEGTGVSCTLDFGKHVTRVESTNMLEETEACLLEGGQTLNVKFSAFEVKTLRLIAPGYSK